MKPASVKSSHQSKWSGRKLLRYRSTVALATEEGISYWVLFDKNRSWIGREGMRGWMLYKYWIPDEATSLSEPIDAVLATKSASLITGHHHWTSRHIDSNHHHTRSLSKPLSKSLKYLSEHFYGSWTQTWRTSPDDLHLDSGKGCVMFIISTCCLMLFFISTNRPFLRHSTVKKGCSCLVSRVVGIVAALVCSTWLVFLTSVNLRNDRAGNGRF